MIINLPVKTRHWDRKIAASYADAIKEVAVRLFRTIEANPEEFDLKVTERPVGGE